MTEIPFDNRDVPEIFASRTVKIEVLSGSILRFWIAVEEDGQYVLALRLVLPLEGAVANGKLLAEVLSRDATARIDVAVPAPLH